MTFIEENSGKIAAALCLASALPVASTVYAMETNVAVRGDTNIVSAVAEKLDLATDYAVEDEEETVAVASVINDKVVTTVKETVSKEVQKITDEHYVPAVERVEEVQAVVEEPISSDNNVTESPVTEDIEEVPIVEEIVSDTGSMGVSDVGAPEVIQETNVSNEDLSTYSDVSNGQESFEQTSQGDVNENEDTTPATDGVVQEETTAPQESTGQTAETQAEQSTNQYSDLNNAIANAAINLVGTMSGYQCTQVVQQALANAGVSDAYQLWPDQYKDTYGYYTDDPQPGNLIYYNNGGRGVDHIAIYIGNGKAVHGNYNGQTVIADANGGTSGCVGQAQYIQVCR